MSDIRTATRDYLGLGWSPVPLEPRGKACIHSDWLTRNYTPEDFTDQLNIGIKSINGLVDVDCDCAEAAFMADVFLPNTQAIYGRVSRPRSHWLFLSEGVSAPIAHKDQIENRTIIELRVNHQSMAPPSTHPGGEAVEWANGVPRQVLTVERTLIVRSVQLCATGAMVARYYNPPGARHDWALALAGFLRQLGLTRAEADRLMTRAAEWARDDKVKDRLDAVRTTYAQDGDVPLTGGSRLAELIGDHGKAFVKTISAIWRGESAAKGILVKGGKLTEIVDRVEAELLAGGDIYQRGGMLTRAVKLDAAAGEAHEVRRAAGATVLVVPEEAYLSERMGQAVPWFRPTSKGDIVPIDPPSIYARTLLARDEWRFPVIRAVVTAPTLASDGRLISEPGFDREAGLLVDIRPGQFPAIRQEPTKDHAAAALEVLRRPLREFPFADDAARAVALSAILTALIRPSLRTAPLHGYDAPTAGTGKSLLAEAGGLLATGVRPPALSQGKSDEEDEKRLSTVLFAGDLVIHIDNCERPLSGDFLCSMLTQEIVQARILGQSERRVMPSTSLVLASGNNLTFAGDVARRAVVCRLDAQVERPDSRAFDFDVHAEVLADRPVLVACGLTILRAYVVAGKPERLTPVGSFTDWEWVRGALVWLGCADPADTRASILDSDPRKDELVTVLEAWATACGAEPIEVAEIGRRADAAGLEGHSGDAPMVALRDALISAACEGKAWNAKSIGWWLRRHKDRIVAGKCLRSEVGRGNKQEWTLVQSGAQGALTL